MKRIDIRKVPFRKRVKIAGWIYRIRDHGKITFLDIYDGSVRDAESKYNKFGNPKLLQIVIENNQFNFNEFDIIEVIGTIKKRQGKLPILGFTKKIKNINIKKDYPELYVDIMLDRIELKCQKIRILNTSKPMPFPIKVF